MPLRGSTRLVALLGHPVAHSLSPAIHNAAFATLDLDLAYAAFDVQPAALQEALRGLVALGMLGANVTRPHKEIVLSQCRDLSDDVRACGAANVLRVCRNPAGTDVWLSADNTDIHGINQALIEAGVVATGRRAVILGAGGAARAAAVALQRGGVLAIAVLARRLEQSMALVAAVRTSGSSTALSAHALADDGATGALSTADIAIDATPGMEPRLLRPLPRDAFVFALAYGAHVPLVAAARAAGRPAIDGTSMLLHQAARAFELWTERPAPLEVMRSALAGALERP